MEIVNAAQMQAIDAEAIHTVGIPGVVLMEHAGTLTARHIAECYAPLPGKRVTLLCGKGNNGGDGFVIARHLMARGAQVTVLLAGAVDAVSGDARINLDAYQRLDGAIQEEDAVTDTLLDDVLGGADLIVDALFGTGLNQPLKAPAADWVSAANAAAVPVVAVDIPSGIDADTGRSLGCAINAAHTVTFSAPKRGHFLTPGTEHSGQLTVADIGIPRAVVEMADIPVRLSNPAWARATLPTRQPAAHKGSFGHTLIVGGSPGLTGAPALAAMGALGVGAGLATAAVPASLNDIMEAKLTEAMTLCLADTADRTVSEAALAPLLDAATQRAVTVIGPGLSQHPESQQLVRDFCLRNPGPMVIDADALNAWQGHLETFPKRVAPTVLTPHPGEMARLIGTSVAAVQSDRIGMACRFAHQHEAVVLLKGAHTIIADPFGKVWINPTGNAALASGGTGDVLAGVIGSLLAQGLDAANAATLGAYLHGLAADLWVENHGPVGLTASTLAAHLGHAVGALLKDKVRPSIRQISALDKTSVA